VSHHNSSVLKTNCMVDVDFSEAVASNAYSDLICCSVLSKRAWPPLPVSPDWSTVERKLAIS
jgi:hypothetical protein